MELDLTGRGAAVVTGARKGIDRASMTITEVRQFERCGHALMIDSGSRELADAVLEWPKSKGH